MLQGLYLVTSVLVIVCNLAADLLYARLDPRVRTRVSVVTARRGRGARRIHGEGSGVGGAARGIRRAHAHRRGRIGLVLLLVFLIMAMFGAVPRAAGPERGELVLDESPRRTSDRRRARTGSAPTSRAATCSREVLYAAPHLARRRRRGSADLDDARRAGRHRRRLLRRLGRPRAHGARRLGARDPVHPDGDRDRQPARAARRRLAARARDACSWS